MLLKVSMLIGPVCLALVERISSGEPAFQSRQSLGPGLRVHRLQTCKLYREDCMWWAGT